MTHETFEIRTRTDIAEGVVSLTSNGVCVAFWMDQTVWFEVVAHNPEAPIADVATLEPEIIDLANAHWYGDLDLDPEGLNDDADLDIDTNPDF